MAQPFQRFSSLAMSSFNFKVSGFHERKTVETVQEIRAKNTSLK
jgi:hypothetical protein